MGDMEPRAAYEKYRDFEITLFQLNEYLLPYKPKITINDPITVNSVHVIKCLSKYLSSEIDKLTMVDWVNIIWFNDAFEFEDEESDSIASVVTVLETMDEEGVVVTDDQIRKMIKCLESNKDYVEYYIDDFLGQFSFLKDFVDKEIKSIQSSPHLDERTHYVSDEVVFNFRESQIVVQSDYADVDLYFDHDEDVLLTIKEDKGHVAVCNIGSETIKEYPIGEKAKKITLFFDEVSSICSSKVCRYPLGLFIYTGKRNIGVWRDLFHGCMLNSDYEEASYASIFSIDEMWDGYEDAPPFRVTRTAFDVKTGEVYPVDERRYK